MVSPRFDERLHVAAMLEDLSETLRESAHGVDPTTANVMRHSSRQLLERASTLRRRVAKHQAHAEALGKLWTLF